MADYPRTRTTARGQLAQWLRLPESWVAFENLQADVLELFRRVFSDAPVDGALYGRRDGAWSEVPSAGAGGVAEAPLDGQQYARQSAAWSPLAAEDDLAPPVVPFVPDDAEALRTEIAELRAIAAVQAQQINDLQQGLTL